MQVIAQRMLFKGSTAMAVLATALSVAPASAETLLIDLQSVSPNRTAIFADDYSRITTPVTDEMFGPIEYRTIEVTMIYEKGDQPYWTEMDLEFKCPKPGFGPNGKPIKKSKKAPVETEDDWVLPNADTVEFRMIKADSRLKNKVNPVPLKPSDWQTTDAYTIKRIYRVACNSSAIHKAKVNSPAADGKTIDLTALRQKLAGLGIDNTLYAPPGSSGDDLANFVWETLWPDVSKPTIDYGPPLTEEQKKEVIAKAQQLKKQLDEQTAAMMAKLEQMKGDNDFIAAAGQFRGGRKWSNVETMMNQVWLTRTEAEVVEAIGRPVVTDAGGARFLSYAKQYDDRYIVRNLASGQEWVDGIYQSCDLDFALIPDSKGVMRVADVVVKARSNAGGSTLGICRGLLDVPTGPGVPNL